LHEVIGLNRHQEFVCDKFKWSAQTYVYIDWHAIAQISKKTTIQKLATCSKMMHNWLSLGQRRQLYVDSAADKLKASQCHTVLHEMSNIYGC
jgi:tryptophanyl-tRNA synthetase